MKADPNGPADTRMMGIVHDALRRDLARLTTALGSRPYPNGVRRAALADHLRWLMDFLRAHHAGEDDGLYPLVRSNNPDAAGLLDRMAVDHRSVLPAMANLRDAGRAWGETGSDADRLSALMAIDGLTGVLGPHLEREENEMMPVVSASITQRQWHAWDQKTNVRAKSLIQLAEEGNWLLDGLDPQRRKIVEAEVPAVPRYVILYGFGPRYRRRAARRWGTAFAT